MNVSSGSEAVSQATKWLGTPYQWGGGHNGPVPIGTPVDCSGLVDQVFGVSGNTGTQVNMGQPVDSLMNAQPGDLIFFGPLAPAEPFHVGIYTGMGMMIDAPHTGTTVRRDTVAGFGTIDGIRRLVPSDGGSGSNTGASGNALFTYAQLEAIWIQANGNPQYASMAAAIAMAESGGDPNASNTNSNSSIDRGLWQINSSNGSSSTFDVMNNARAAVKISNNGTNWRPWCTAYSDGACGTKGGCYQCPGSPYMKFYSPNTPPDYNISINATNAAANQTNAELTAAGGGGPSVKDLGILGCVFDPIGCADSVAADVIKSVIKSILTPLVQLIAGVLGVGAGAIMMIFGFYLIIGSTRTGRQAERAAKTGVRLGARVVAPESALAGARRSTYERQLPGGQTQITTVVGRRRRGGYQQRSYTNVYGRPGASPGAPGGPRRPRDDLRDEAASYGGPEELNQPPRPRPAYGGPGSRGGRRR